MNTTTDIAQAPFDKTRDRLVADLDLFHSLQAFLDVFESKPTPPNVSLQQVKEAHRSATVAVTASAAAYNRALAELAKASNDK